jgi:TPP-dependent pyruvate/acetoin dehydrogenase alpha subunit
LQKFDFLPGTLSALAGGSRLNEKINMKRTLLMGPSTNTDPLPARLFRSLYRIRRVEEEIARVYPLDKIISPVHLSIGQEAISVAVCEALQPHDVVFGSYRCHALYLAKGGDLRAMIAELFGKATGCAKGKAGSMHLIDVAAGVMGASAVVGTTIPQAVGYAFALKVRKQPAIVASFFGDGAVEEGVFHESLNFAALKRVPMVFVCENNDLAIHSRQQARQSWPGICALVGSYGIPAERFEEMDALHIHARLQKAVAEIRSGQSGPQFFECVCCRWKEHVGPGDDFHTGYRTRAEAEPWLAADQVKVLGAQLDPHVRQKIENAVDEEIRSAFEFAEKSPFPDGSELYTDLYKST